MQDYFVGRQPIYNVKLECYGYELLFRSSATNSANFGSINADSATSITLMNVFIEIGIKNLIGNAYAFINLTESFLLNEDSLPISPDHVVLEILEDVPINDALISAVQRLKKSGFIIALDDYIYNPSHKVLIEMADIIKIDIMQLSRAELIEHVDILKKYKAKLLAEKIETMDEYDHCVDLGFDYFQGYFLGKPRVIQGEGLPTNKMAILNLLAILHNPESDILQLEQAISVDVTLSYKMLKLINSAFFNFSQKIDSIKDVIVILGRKKLASWASVMVMASMDNRPLEMIRMAMLRAKMCELLADKKNLSPMDSYFTVGLFSALDILMERKLSELIAPLPLSNDIVDALLKYQGRLGEALACTLAYEVSDFETAQFMDLTPRDILDAKLASIAWTNEVVQVL